MLHGRREKQRKEGRWRIAATHSTTEHGWVPTFTEIGEARDIGSRGHVQYHLIRLEREGYLVRQHHAVRALRLTEAGQLLASVDVKPEGRDVIPLSG